ncbi:MULTISPECIES: outer membrane lipoprotein chaperone LolA [unclassified Microbulbifer]|uniref:outer membrane lipoprotein chaperone LolA n=1 Tax=unclassified Microbulbifer TaxID=2619833 RepID=UPI001E2B06B9|nr:outer membrane lipoprotein chaperone LolA [Microbulbifer sp. YPW16]UHQ55665.1 outer membrane lipoprotein chaperone LolA [Microbulbifer sp. YPW16]
MKRFVTAFAASAALLASSAWADATAELSQLLQPLASISGKFHQTLTDERGEVLQKSSGTFSVERPGKLRWETGEPFPQLLVTNNKKLWLYDPDLEQVTIRPVDKRMKETPALLLGGKVGEIRSSFNVASKDGAFQLTPKSASAPFRAMEIRFADSGLPAAMTVRDSMGQTTKIKFSRVKANPSLAAALFNFEPPAGTDIIRDE